MRSQKCREHIDQAAEYCGLEKSTVSDVKQAAKFCASNSEFSDCATDAIIALIRVKDEEVKNRAISLVKNALIEETPTGGKKNNKFTKPAIRKYIKKAELEYRGELVETIKAETPLPASPFQPAAGSIPQTDLPPQPSLAQQISKSALPPLSPDADWDEKLKRDNLLLEMAKNGDTGGFVPASTLINGGFVTKPAPYKITPEPLPEPEADNYIMQVVTRRFTPKSKEIWDKILASGEMSDTPARLFEDIVCRVGGE